MSSDKTDAPGFSPSVSRSVPTESVRNLPITSRDRSLPVFGSSAVQRYRDITLLHVEHSLDIKKALSRATENYRTWEQRTTRILRNGKKPTQSPTYQRRQSTHKQERSVSEHQRPTVFPIHTGQIPVGKVGRQSLKQDTTSLAAHGRWGVPSINISSSITV